VERVQLADRLGYDYVFSAEANGSDAISPLGFVLGATKRIGVGARVASNTCRSPAALAMAFQTMRHIGGPNRRYIVGVGNGATPRAEGWDGIPWTSPYWRMQDYVAIMRKAASGEPIEHDGRVLTVPYHALGSAPDYPGMKSLLETYPDDVKIMCAGGTELMIRLAGKIGDGYMVQGNWMPEFKSYFHRVLGEGIAQRSDNISIDDFPIWSAVDVFVTDDVKAALGQFKEYMVRFARRRHLGAGLQMQLRGYGEVLDRVVELIGAGRLKEAEDAIPDEYIEEGYLIGPLERIVERWRSKWINTGAHLIVRTDNWPSAKRANNEVYEPMYRALRG
jgi:alkanesulfonate monooxygenase SsuD/methylene tetrahydromethanopterin reductase-like flavin-dependent oxidoreductase (luciferase family)